MNALLIALAVAAAPASPLNVVKNGTAEVQKILASSDASTEKLAARADEFIDFAELAKRALGKEWGKLNKKQQDEFAITMKELLRASYAQKAIGDAKGGTSNAEYGEEKIEGNEATVHSTILVNKEKFPVDYKLYRPDAKSAWRIYDVVTDQVSLMATYQDQFKTVIAKKGYDGLLTTLKAKRDQLGKKETASASATP